MSAKLRCTGTPISWLRLEQHATGELAPAASQEITDHLATCPACASCLTRIEADSASVLPPLPARPVKMPAPSVSRLRRLAPPLAALALAAAVLFFFVRRPPPEDSGFDPTSARVKGGDVSLTLVRDDETLVAEAGGSYRDGDRWKALVTCPPGMRASFDLAVYERGQPAAFPLPPSVDLACGNAVPLPGAFRTTGHEPMTVCLVWSDGAAVDRAALGASAPELLPHAACKSLHPAP